MGREKQPQALPSQTMMRALCLYVYRIGWMLIQFIGGLVALCLIPFQPKRQTISAGSFYHDD